MNTVLRTNLFRFDPAQLGHAYQAVLDRSFYDAWYALKAILPNADKNLPTRGLEELLAALSHGPVKVQARPSAEGRVPAILLLNRISTERLNEAFEVWASEVLKEHQVRLPDLAKRLVVQDVIDLDAAALFTEDTTLPSAYIVVPWLAGQLLAAKPLQAQADVPVKLTPAADYRHDRGGMTLLTWENPIVAPNQSAIAHHVLDLKLSLLHGRHKPYLDLRVHVNRVMPSWVGQKKHAWVNTGSSVVCCKVRTLPPVDGKFVTEYVHPTSRLLGYLGAEPLPAIIEGDIPISSKIRPIHASTPSFAEIGAGAGPIFFDQASFHVAECIPGAEPMLAEQTIRSFIRQKTAPVEPLSIKVMVLAASSNLLMRLHNAAKAVGKVSGFFKKAPAPTFVLGRLSVADASHWLLNPCKDNQGLAQWFAEQVLPEVLRSGVKVVIVETTPDVAKKSDFDPKHKLRSLFALHGIRTQFIFHPRAVPKRRSTGKPDQDHPATNALIDTIRLHGLIPLPLPQCKAVPPDSVILSIYLERVSIKGPANLPLITRLQTGSQRPEVFWFSDRTKTIGRWYPYEEAIAHIHSTPELLSDSEVTKLVSQTFLSPTPLPGQPLIVCLDKNLSSIYRGLQDTLGGGLPPVPEDAAIVRVRSDTNSALMTGNHSASPHRPVHIGNHVGLYRAQDDARVHYFVAPSKVFNKERSHRDANRYTTEYGMDKPWHQLGVTELLVMQVGCFKGESAVAEQIGLLCRHAPLWDWYLRLPGPMHLGKKIGADHPLVETLRSSIS
ncbi:RNaseH domain-containing protein [Pseudomonas sp. GM48]|uniref:RNaseH domain-containing protein n=1 Tax=Pseudomonas sp. GM48 TaxID=1144330 RepID=UPI00026FDDC2|nr:RNaseH domain-containing protein [Pseudomonas sp. GM48]EJM56183.1 hypothetical protein PMI28_03164 [Pseudomonas sp. GM48]